MQIDDDGSNIGVVSSNNTANTRNKSASFAEPTDASLLMPEDLVTGGTGVFNGDVMICEITNYSIDVSKPLNLLTLLGMQ